VDVDSSAEVHVSAYVDLPLDAVLERLVDDLLNTAVVAALGTEGVVVDARVRAPVWVSSGHVRVPVTWSLAASAGSASDGAATISLLVVQSGGDAITELLVTLPAPAAGERASTALHQVLHELTTRLESPSG
jgi:hypothetical protein